MQRMIAATAAVVITLGSALLGLQRSDEPVGLTRQPRHWVKLTFGLDDEVADWDGSVSVQDGRILNLESWGFEPDHELDAGAGRWQCSTLVKNRRSESTYAEGYRGILVELVSNDATTLTVQTKQGNFSVDVSQLAAGRLDRFLNGRASAELLGTAQPLVGRGGLHPQLPDTTNDDDFPTLTVDGHGNRWVAWIRFNRALDQDELQVLDLDSPEATATQIDAGRFQATPLLLTDQSGKPWLFWTAPRETNWDIHATRWTDNGWTKPERISTAAGTDFHLSGARGPRGELWLTWQSFRNGNGDVIAKCWRGDRWTSDIPVTQGPANEWEPAISVDRRGRAWIGYDSYQNGNYDVYLKTVTLDGSGSAKVGPELAIATSPDFEAHASVEATGDNVWVAYDAAGPNWGKDVAGSKTTYRGSYAEPLHTTRRVELRVIVGGRVFAPQTALPQKLATLRPSDVGHRFLGEVRRFYEMPQLARDANGRLWVFFRLNRQGNADAPQPALWEVLATTYVNQAWVEPILLPQSWGRQNQRISVASRDTKTRPAEASMWCSWSRGRHHTRDASQSIRVGALPPVTGAVADPPLRRHDVPQATATAEPLIKSWQLHRGGKSYEVYFGDLHRHTDISWCYPTTDGCPVDAYRYALDAARLDFLAITDHTRDTDPYPWWHTQKVNDLFNVSGTFTTIYGYERSNQTPGGGHRNVFFVERDWPVLRSEHHYQHISGTIPPRLDPPTALYPKLQGKNAFTAAHTPAYSASEMRGTWSYGNAEVEPLVEIFQGFRRSYERPGAGVAEEASIWYALNRGYRLGFIASSDHVSTHVSYACVWAEGRSREQLFEAMRARRTYAATDKILLDVRVGDAFMGEEAEVIGKPVIKIRVRGTADINEIEIIKNAEVLWRTSPGKRDVEIEYRDQEYSGEAAWYYVRIRQTDDAIAWGSPIWVN